MSEPLVTSAERKRIRDAKIRSLYNTKVNGVRVYNMDEVVMEMRKLGYGVSKTTVFFAINGRSRGAAGRHKKRKN